MMIGSQPIFCRQAVQPRCQFINTEQMSYLLLLQSSLRRFFGAVASFFLLLDSDVR